MKKRPSKQERLEVMIALAASRKKRTGQSCPPAHKLAALVAKRVNPKTRAHLLEHINGCSDCYQAWLAMAAIKEPQKANILHFIRRSPSLTAIGSIALAASLILVLWPFIANKLEPQARFPEQLSRSVYSQKMLSSQLSGDPLAAAATTKFKIPESTTDQSVTKSATIILREEHSRLTMKLIINDIKVTRFLSMTIEEIISLAGTFNKAVQHCQSNPFPQARRLYDQLIAPIAPDLTRAGIHHLIFDLPESLKNLPMSALYDGHEFLAQRFSITRLMPPPRGDQAVKEEILTLWPVAEDVRTAFLQHFQSLYKTGHMVQAEALRQTQQEFITKMANMKNDIAHPCHWASFILVENRP
ncbi:MAG: CHAT domain-containing protein [Magnetococcales bacterium]|nr:CHAT domain-containing protein [Magnetococcales bacterium]